MKVGVIVPFFVFAAIFALRFPTVAQELQVHRPGAALPPGMAPVSSQSRIPCGIGRISGLEELLQGDGDGISPMSVGKHVSSFERMELERGHIPTTAILGNQPEMRRWF